MPINGEREQGDARWVVAIMLALTALYFAVFRLTEGSAPYWNDLLFALSNALPAVLLGWLLARLHAPLLSGFGGLTRILLGMVAVAIYAVTAYLATVMLLALLGEVGPEGVFVRFFTGRALTWQLFQGLAYGVIALLIGLLVEARQKLAMAQVAALHPTGQPTPPDRWLIRTDEGIVPIEPDAIIHIRAADDYCELILPTTRHLARMTMAECEKRLVPLGFIRVHRSHLINLSRLVSAEPAGNGRLQLLLGNGDTVVTSRTGAQDVRARTV